MSEHYYESDDDYPEDEFEEAMANCCGHFIDGVFWCGAAGSEDCDFDCPFSHDIGLTVQQIEQRDAEADLGKPATRKGG